jgi:hypothetical protein
VNIDLLKWLESGETGIALCDREVPIPSSERLSNGGFQVCELDGNKCLSEGRFLVTIGEALKLPRYYGANWDSLHECLVDRMFGRRQRTVLIVYASDRIAEALGNTRLAKIRRNCEDVLMGRQASGYAHMPEVAYPSFHAMLITSSRCEMLRAIPRVVDMRPS